MRAGTAGASRTCLDPWERSQRSRGESRERWRKKIHNGNYLIPPCHQRAEAAEGARVFTVINYCKTTIWPGITLENSFNGGGFPLKPGESVVFTAPVGWVGRIWRRTGCDFDRNGNGSCQTGTCGSVLKCSASGQTPTTLVEFTLAPLDFYDVSLVDGFNLPLTVTPVNGQGGHCSSAGMKCPRLDM
ncbi:unnamed protein product [Musa hybrid cultivar]